MGHGPPLVSRKILFYTNGLDTYQYLNNLIFHTNDEGDLKEEGFGLVKTISQ